ncbi:MAG: porin [Janthinobacterium lividum]
MKRKLVLTLAGLGLLTGAGAVRAQSSVTLYGVIDVGIDWNNNSGGQKLWHMQDGTYDGMYGSRWGLKGIEDLGGGWKALFVLENGFNLNNGSLGQSGRMFGRQAFVGLSNDRYGTVRVGRQYDSIVDYIQPVTLTGNLGGLFIHSGDIDNTANSFRVNNAIKYTSPTFGGLTFGGLYSFTNSNADGVGTTGVWSLGASYSYKTLNLAAAYFYAKKPASLFNDGDFVSNTAGAAIGASGPFSYVGNPGNQQIVGVGGSYGIGAFTLGADYTNTRFDDANGTSSSVRFSNYEAWLSYSVTTALTLGAGYTFTDGKVDYLDAKPKYHQINLAADYHISKRTEFYLNAAVQQASGDAKSADLFDAVIGNASSTNRQLAMRLGVVHKF